MSAKSNKTVIGAFVVGAVALAVGGVLAFGGGRFFSDDMKVVFYFDGSVGGLGLGAPIVLKGVKIGAVNGITLQYDVDTGDFRTRVTGEILRAIEPVGQEASVARLLEQAEASVERLRRDLLSHMVGRGMRAQLAVQSFVTGLLQVELDYRTDVAPATVELDASGHWRLPTIPSNMEVLSATFEKLPLADIVDKMDRALGGLERLLSSDDTRATVEHLRNTMAAADELAGKIDRRFDAIDADIGAVVETAKQLLANGNDGVTQLRGRLDAALQRAQELIANVDARVDPVAADLHALSDAANASLAEARVSLAAFRGTVGADSMLAFKATSTLDALTGAMDNLRSFLAYLEQHPEALLRGK